MFENLSLTDIIIAILVAAFGIIAIRFSFTFDINKFLESREEKAKRKIQTNCPHVMVEDVEGGVGIRSTFFSPYGTTAYICQRCGLATNTIDEMSERRRLEYYSKNPEELKRQEKKFAKLLKKSGYL